MAMKSKGSRPITVDQEAYRWSFKDNGGMALLVVQSARGQGRKLTASVGRFENVWLTCPNALSGGFISCTPAMVRDVIRAARDAGWRPLTSGPEFHCHWVGGENVTLRVWAAGAAQ